ncbi:MAG: AtpZ/AtpI family protein [Alphaproteobacteria bacterium]|nr:MAG: AtpZ/AtpI family protein [Alphaproteobacteria bacterium]
MTGPDLPSEKEFRARLEKARQKQDEKSWESRDLEIERSGAAGKAWRLSVEMVAALMFCSGLGWLLDRWFETKPWLMLVFVVIGGVVGIYNVFKTAKRMNASDFEE